MGIHTTHTFTRYSWEYAYPCQSLGIIKEIFGRGFLWALTGGEDGRESGEYVIP